LKILRTGALAFVIALLSGCITFFTEIHVSPDGSGTLVQTVSMNPEAFKGAVDGIVKGLGGSGEVKETTEHKDANPDQGPFSTAQLAEKARGLGEGVTFVSAEPIQSATAQGVRVTYRFRDISKVFVNPKPAAAMGTEGAGKSAPKAMRFRFERQGGRSVLTAVLPPDQKKSDAPPPPASSDVDEQQLAMLKQMFKGMHLRLTIDVDGRITSTNAAFHTDDRVTLMDLDLDPLLEKPETLKALNDRLAGAMGDDAKTAAALSELPGIRIDTKPEIRIEFAGR
jgi:hypothetical protein